jgi:hypothetical protein
MKYKITIDKIIPKTKDDYATTEEVYSQTLDIQNPVDEGNHQDYAAALINSVIKAVNGL